MPNFAPLFINSLNYMKKFIYTIAASAALLTACQPNNSYRIDGTIKGVNDGDTIYLQEVSGRAAVTIDSTVVAGGKFAFKGTTDTIKNAYIVYKDEGRPAGVSLFLEKGNIKVDINENKVSGTVNNDIYGQYTTAISEKYDQMSEIWKSMMDSTITEEAKEAKSKEMEALQDECGEITKKVAKDNIATEAGLYLFLRNYYQWEIEDQENIIAAMPEAFQNRERVIEIKEQIEVKKKTSVGKEFTDFEMQTPEGETVKLSDFISKNKVTLVDFWASWCGPCRAEMPNVVAAYNKYKAKGFGVVGVSLDSKADAWKDAIENLGITWPQMSDLKGWQCEGSKLYGVNAIPATVLIGQDGIIIARDLRGEDIEAKLAEILK